MRWVGTVGNAVCRLEGETAIVQCQLTYLVNVLRRREITCIEVNKTLKKLRCISQGFIIYYCRHSLDFYCNLYKNASSSKCIVSNVEQIFLVLTTHYRTLNIITYSFIWNIIEIYWKLKFITTLIFYIYNNLREHHFTTGLPFSIR